MCQNCGCRKNPFDYTKKYSAENDKQDITLSCHFLDDGTPQVKGVIEGVTNSGTPYTDTRFDDYNYFMTPGRYDDYNIIDNTTEDCGGKGSGEVAPPKDDEDNNGNGNGQPQNQTKPADTDTIGLAIATLFGGAILIAAFSFFRR